MIGRIPYTEIAKEAGVNVKTLYRVLNNEPLVKETTRKRIIDALNRNGCFEQRVTAAENVVFDVMKSPYQERQAMALLKRLSPDRFHCSIFNAELEREKFLRQCETASVAVFFSHPLRGVLEAVRERNPDILQINMFGSCGGDITVQPDDTGGGAAAARWLYENGHRRVAVVTNRDSGQWDRCKGFCAEMLLEYPNVTVEKHIDVETPFEIRREQLFAKNRPMPTAFFATCGWWAFQIYLRAMEVGIRVPEDLSILGYDEPSTIGLDESPALDYVYFDPAELSGWGEYFIMKRPFFRKDREIRVLTEARIVPRGSVKKRIPELKQMKGNGK